MSSVEGAGYLRSPGGIEPSAHTPGAVCWGPVMCFLFWEERVGVVQNYSISPVTAWPLPPYSENELWANPVPPASPPVLCSHKALHYHRARRDAGALRSGVRCGEEKVVVAKWKAGALGGYRFIVSHHIEPLCLLLREWGLSGQLRAHFQALLVQMHKPQVEAVPGHTAVFVFMQWCRSVPRFGCSQVKRRQWCTWFLVIRQEQGKKTHIFPLRVGRTFSNLLLRLFATF